MKRLTSLSLGLGILSGLLIANPGVTQNRSSDPPIIPNSQPNTTITVTRRSGNCPSSVKMWTSFRSYEGGVEHTVFADISAIANSAKVSNSGAKFVEFTAPLKSEFASCVGEAVSDEEPIYRFRFSNKQVVFRMDLSAIPGERLTRISYRGLVSSRPAIRWAMAD